MTDGKTVPRDATTLPVRTVRVRVVTGPDAGKTATADRLSIGSDDGNDLALADPTVSRYHVELTRDAGIRVIDHGSTNGCFVGGLRVQHAIMPAGTQLRLGDTVIEVDDGDRVEVELSTKDTIAGLYGSSAVMRRLMAQVQRSATAVPSVLLLGESGTGKEVVARALHALGPRAGQPFEIVDCGVLSPNLMASELFGHERGAFTGADRQHIGAFERAHGGTLFLDEIGELAPALQVQLLGALERRRFRRLGGKQDLEADVRVVAATHRDVRAEVNAGRFRLDLFHRIAVIKLTIPALRERPEDLGLLIEHFMRETGSTDEVGRWFPPATMRELAAYPWPGNVRELRNLVEATLAMGEVQALPHGEVAPGADVIERSLHTPYKDARANVLAEFETRYLKRLIEASGGNVSKAARDAGMDRTHLIELLHRHGLR